MDLEFLRTLGVVPKTFETAELQNGASPFLQWATLARSEGDSVYGTMQNYPEMSSDVTRGMT